MTKQRPHQKKTNTSSFTQINKSTFTVVWMPAANKTLCFLGLKSHQHTLLKFQQTVNELNIEEK